MFDHQIHHVVLPPKRLQQRLLCALFVLALTGCASGGFLDKSMELVGLKKPDTLSAADIDAAKAQVPRQVTLRIHAGQVLNTDTSGRALSLVTRVYRLRSTAQFSQATYAMFSTSSQDKPAFSEDVVSMQELVLTPGQKYEVVETLPNEITHIAVVALFRAPDPQRWRFVFETKAAAKSGITLGVHGCAMSVAAGEPVSTQPDALRLAGVQCR